MDQTDKRKRLEELRAEVTRLEEELASEEVTDWAPTGYYYTYHNLAGAFLGLFGASTSLLFNVVGAVLTGLHPLQLIKVYLTFPLGDTALQLSGGVDEGLALAIGCCLYLATGMVLGIPFHHVQNILPAKAHFIHRLLVASVFAIAVWIINFYLILSWLQPLLFGGQWIVQEIPWWVAALTHLVFGWTMALVYPLGVFVPYKQTEVTP